MAGYDLSDRLSVWAVAGHGTGDLAVTPPDAERAMRTDLALTMAAAGARGELVSRAGTAGPALAIEADAMFARTTSDRTAGLAAAEADTSRLRLGLEGSYAQAFEGGATLTPTVEIGVRHDGGDHLPLGEPARNQAPPRAHQARVPGLGAPCGEARSPRPGTLATVAGPCPSCVLAIGGTVRHDNDDSMDRW